MSGVARHVGRAATVVVRRNRFGRPHPALPAGGPGPLGEGVGEAVGLGAGLDDVPAKGEPVDYGGAQARVGEGLGPATKALVEEE